MVGRVLALGLLLGGTAAHAEAPIIFIHGIKGATLLGDQGQVRWLTAGEALGFSSYDLRLPLRWTGNSQDSDGLKAGAPLRQISVIPKIYVEKIYGPWLEAQEKTHAKAFHAYAYDWRRDNVENATAFEAFIDRVRAETGNARVRVVAHSMGGLITLSVLLRSPQKFQSVVFVGVPFAGGIGFLNDLHAGSSVGWNRGILSPEVLFTYPSVYTLLPDGSRGLADGTGEALPIDYYQISDWRRYKLGVFAAGEPTADKIEYFNRALDRAKVFRASLRLPPHGALPPVLVVSGKSVPTLVTALRGGPQSVRGWDFSSAPMAPGDGRVAYEHSLPPANIVYQTFETSYDHSNLLNDPAVIKRIDAFFAATAAKP